MVTELACTAAGIAAATRVAAAAAAPVDPFALAELPPSPDGRRLHLTMPCRSGARGRSARHPVVLHPDWTVTTPHDLELERIAVAMGGARVSCLDLAEREAGALRTLVQVRARRAAPGIARTRGGEWLVRTPVAGCRCTTPHRRASESAEHLRGLVHAGFRASCSPERLGRLLTAVERAHDTTWGRVPEDEWGATACVRERDGLARLWEAGLHPELVARIHAGIWAEGPAMPAWFYLGAATRQADLGWLAETLRAAPDPAIAVWLAWTATDADRAAPGARGEWLRAGISRPHILALTAARYIATDVARLAAFSTRSIPRCGRVLAAWHLAGCRPSVEDLVGLDRLDVDPWYEPSRRAVDWLCTRVPPSRPLSRTQAGLILAACGTRGAALHAITLGATDPNSAVAALKGT
ncbi:MAG: hypothetical protein EPN43_07290 [Jatrophihabitans sp.]|nr:MAG: hypothetical protein EPN43_07290 [Jatrophihabitans sp.]